MDTSWKDCYFSSIFDIRMHQPEDDDCNCIYGRHLQQDLLYGMYTYNGTVELQECFGPRSGPCFDVETYTHRCCRLTPSRYISQFPEAYAHLRKVHIDGAIKSVSDALNTELILDHQNNLEVVTSMIVIASSPDKMLL